MPVRKFANAKGGSRIVTAVGKADPAGAFTVCALVKRGTAERNEGLWSRFAAGHAFTDWTGALLNNTEHGIEFNPGSNAAFHPPGEGHWLFVAMVRTASGSKCKYFIFDFKAGTWSIKEDTEVSNIVHNFAATTCILGAYGSIVNKEGEGLTNTIAALAVFNSALTQAEAEAIKGLASLEEWLTKSPLALWLFNQAGVSEPVTDLTGNGANQTEQIETEVLAEEPPIPYTTSGTKPENVEAPKLTGTATVGEELTVTNGKWVNNPTKFTYKWQEAQKAAGPWITIIGATGPTLTLTSPEINRFIRCVVTATNAAGSGEANSNELGPVERSEDEIEGNEHGFPDWQQFPEYQPEPEYVNPEFKVTAAKVIGTFFMGQVPAVNLYFKQLSGNEFFRVRLIWHDRLAIEPVEIVQDFYLHNTAGFMNLQVACLARYLTVKMEPVAIATAMTYEVRIQRTLSVGAERRFGDSLVFTEPNVEVPKEGSKLLTFTRTATGPARLLLTATGEGPGRTVVLEKISTAGVEVRMLKFVLPEKSGLAAYQIDLPSTPLLIRLGNTTAAAIFVDVAIGTG